ncbi:MAG: GNAT family N-acetyltransferase, partial [Pseudomonadota bacterium]
MNITIKEFWGEEINAIIEQIANLRITIFREFPYLYDGNLEYERNYLATYANSKNSIIIAAYECDKLIGVSSGIAMSEETEEFCRPFLEQNYDINKIFYCGETILLKEYRGQGIYTRFMQARENHAKKCGFEIACFCAVERPQDHKLRPHNYS